MSRHVIWCYALKNPQIWSHLFTAAAVRGIENPSLSCYSILLIRIERMAATSVGYESYVREWNASFRGSSSHRGLRSSWFQRVSRAQYGCAARSRFGCPAPLPLLFYLLVDMFSTTLLSKVGIQSADLIATAISVSSAIEETIYRRLEFNGDSVLKLRKSCSHGSPHT